MNDTQYCITSNCICHTQLSNNTGHCNNCLQIPICYDKFNPELDNKLQNLSTKGLKRYTPNEYIEHVRKIIGR